MKKQFKTESKRILDLMVNSIYTHKEIFLRELISNASDAIDKLYYRSLSDNDTGLGRDSFSIDIKADKDARTLIITDNGCGMTKEELENNLGTIAHSGTLDFRNDIAEKENKDEIDVIGQFGVGFYSAFMVADRIVVRTKAYGSDTAFEWESEGADGYTVTECDKEGNGTEITLYLRANTEENCFDDYLDQYTLKGLIKKYSDYIRYPIKMDVTEMRPVKNEDGKPDDYEEVTENQTINSMVPIWKKNRNEITKEEYEQFYTQNFYDYQAPLKYAHMYTEGSANFSALLYIPSKAPANYYTKEYEKGLKLYASGVLITDSCKELLPDYFGFVKGLVDSQDLSLNISREMLQHDGQLKLIAKRIEKRIKSDLENMLKNDRENYEKFFDAFGLQLKYGLYSGFGQNNELLSDLILFHSSREGRYVSLDDYVTAMPEGQKAIYYVCSESEAKAALLPQTERLRDKGYEILYLTEDVDEFAIKMLGKYKDKDFCSAAAAGAELDDEEDVKEAEKKAEENKGLFDAMKDALDGKVVAVRPSKILKTHPVCLTAEGEISLEMEKILAAMPGESGMKARRVLEINTNHPVFEKLSSLVDDKETLAKYCTLLYDQALLIEGLPVEDPVEFSNLICELMK